MKSIVQFTGVNDALCDIKPARNIRGEDLTKNYINESASKTDSSWTVIANLGSPTEWTRADRDLSGTSDDLFVGWLMRLLIK